MTTTVRPAESAATSANTIYFIIGVASVALLSLSLVQGGADRWALVPALIGTAGLVFHWRTAPLGLLVAVAIGKVLPLWYYGGAGLSRIGSLAADLMLSAAILSYLMAQYRLLSLRVAVLPADPRNPRSKPPARDAASVPAREATGALLTAAAATIGAFFLWELTSLFRPPWTIIPAHWRVELLVWILAFGLIGLASVIGYLSWRRQSRREALLFLRDEFWRQTRGEQRRINRWRAWARRRQERAGRPIDS
jgi:hypothetical protein